MQNGLWSSSHNLDITAARHIFAAYALYDFSTLHLLFLNELESFFLLFGLGHWYSRRFRVLGFSARWSFVRAQVASDDVVALPSSISYSTLVPVRSMRVH